MSTPPETPSQPAHLRPLTIEILRSWTPEEALAVFKLIDDLREKIWMLCDVKLQASLCEQCVNHGAGGSSDALDEGSF